MTKTIFKGKNGEIHFGRNAPVGFAPGTLDDVKKSLSKPGKMKLWRCRVCHDLHLGLNFPSPCPTCSTPNSYDSVSEKDFKAELGL